MTKDVVVNIEIITVKSQAENEVCLCVSSDIEFNSICQRCLEGMIDKIGVSIKSKKRTGRDVNFYFSHEEIFDSENLYCKNGELDLIRLCEDDFLLGLPMVPRHKIDCSPPQYNKLVQKISRPNPFAVVLKSEEDKI